MTEKQYKVGYFDEPNDVDSYVECDGEYLNATDVVTLLNELSNENEQLKQFKELIYTVLKQEYEDKINEMNMWAEKEDWNGYRATKLEYGTVVRVAKKIGVDLND